MGYTIHYYDQATAGAHRLIPMVFRDKVSVLDYACALRKAGFRIFLIEGPSFEMRHTAFEAYYGARMCRLKPLARRSAG
jgi:hypothetical protein